MEEPPHPGENTPQIACKQGESIGEGNRTK